MSGPQFFQTQMGKSFYDHTMPELVRELKRLNRNLETSFAVVIKLAERAVKKMGGGGDVDPE